MHSVTYWNAFQTMCLDLIFVLGQNLMVLRLSPSGARSASVQADNVLSEEQVQFSVTRHTPRRRPPTRRTLSDMEDSPKIADKRRKLDGDEQNRGATSMAKNRSTSEYIVVCYVTFCVHV